ncbi:[NiFe] hydrogenase metallocenter assembly protein HypD [Klebsiella pneumoniae subsp. rhinoscleromatis]|nr:[NiFe] hydrogenase metallocenter assembly protein HypD [Klebsiella pneumoniae subsp. rhinoscleromatis]
MRYVDEYRAPEQVMQLVAHLQQRARLLPHTAARPLRIMEVCGGHTHAIFKFGLDQLLPENIEFIHGPGCPVCVLPMGRIDACIEIASRPGVIFCTFGDAMRVPGKNGSLLQAKARGADVRIVYSPMDALRLAQQNPQREVVFFGLGFETTMPATALTLRQARERNVDNFYFFCQHITLLPTLRSLLDQPENGIDAFLAPGHVSMVIGTEAYGFIASDYHRPLVVAGFEPLDLLQGAVMLVEQTIAQRCGKSVPSRGAGCRQPAGAGGDGRRLPPGWRQRMARPGGHQRLRRAAYASLSALRCRGAFSPGAAARVRRPARPLRRGADRPL